MFRTFSRALFCASLALIGFVATGCATHSAGGTLAGGLLGAGAGALIGHAAGDSGAGAIIGGGSGAVIGGLLGHSIDTYERGYAEGSSNAYAYGPPAPPPTVYREYHHYYEPAPPPPVVYRYEYHRYYPPRHFHRHHRHYRHW